MDFVKGFMTIVTLLLGLAAVSFLAYITTKFIGNKTAQNLKGKLIQVVDMLSLGFDKNIYLVKVQNNFILLHSSPKGLEYICNVEITDIEEVDENLKNKTEGIMQNPFENLFKKYIHKISAVNVVDDNGNAVKQSNNIPGNIEKLKNLSLDQNVVRVGAEETNE